MNFFNLFFTLASLGMFGRSSTHLTPTNQKQQSPSLYSCSNYLPAKNLRHQRILQSDWTRVFWPITCVPEFSQIYTLQRKIENQKIFHCGLFPAKNTEKFSKTSQKPYLGPILGSFYMF